MKRNEKANCISRCLQLAILLEAGAHKPGNVSVVTDFENTRYEHFLASAVAVTPSFERAAERGVGVLDKNLEPSNVRVGQLIRDCLSEIESWQHGGNTLLGTVILLIPVAVAAGMSEHEKGSSYLPELRKNLEAVVKSTTPQDAVHLYEGIGIANPSGLNSVSKLDVNDPNSKKRIIEEQISLLEVFRIAEKYDSICSEWVNNYPITFDFAYPSLDEQLKKGKDLTVAIIQTFLEVLAEYPDTFIARKAGVEKARAVSSEAREVLELGGLETTEGRRALNEFDKRLRVQSNLLNPGTTADIIAAALSLCVLGGYRP